MTRTNSKSSVSTPGRCYWITGLAGAGKTTIGSLLFQHLKHSKRDVVFLDGDVLREVFGNRHGYTSEARLELAMCYCRLCKMLVEQGKDVVCATISMFPAVWEWNRTHLSDYREIYIQTPMDVLIVRDPKQLYSRALRGEITDVMGIDIQVQPPNKPHVVLRNDGSSMPDAVLDELLALLSQLDSKVSAAR